MSYKSYYQRTIAHHKIGLKLVVGGTGLGKTRGVVDAVAELEEGKKAIYIANRLKLLNQIETDVSKDPRLGPERVILLSRDAQVVFRIFQDFDKRSALLKFMAQPAFKADKKSYKQLQKVILEIDSLIEKYNARVLGHDESLALLEDPVRQLLHVIQGQMVQAYRTAQKRWKEWMTLPIIHALFPYIAFERSQDAKLLLVSLHKAYYGFFDGRRKRSGMHLQGYIVFADEFDFLEKDLVDLIAREREIDDPFSFVASFYREYTRHKEHRATYPDIDQKQGEIRTKLNEIRDQVAEIKSDEHIDYPDYNHFLNKDTQSKDMVIFRTSHTITSQTVYLYQTDRGFAISLSRDLPFGNPTYADRLFRPVASASERILTLLKEVEQHNEKTAEQLKRDLFPNTTFIEQMRRITQYPRPRPYDISPQGSLLQSGFSMYDIYHLDSETDHEEIELRHYAMYLTPEAFIAEIARNNLLFGLSATADIPRCVNHFDLQWLRLEGNVQIIDPDEQDRAEVEAMSAAKASARANTVHVQHLRTLNTIMDARLREAAVGLQRTIATAMQFEELGGGIDTEKKHRQQRLDLFFASVLHATQQPELRGEVQSHLVFLNTYKEIEQFFKHEMMRSSAVYHIEIDKVSGLWRSYRLTILDRSFRIVFYNAERARHFAANPEAEQDFFSLFHGSDPVFVVTQYQSAGNGLNLQYTLPDGQQRDFLNLHVLEVPYFYFAKVDADDTAEQQAAAIKKNIWYLAKLHEAKFISQAEFRTKLAEIHSSQGWNNFYRTQAATRVDQQRNAAAALIQVIGRIERERTPTPDQSVFLSDEAFAVLEAYLLDNGGQLAQRREAITSGNLRQVLAQIDTELQKKRKIARRTGDPRLIQADHSCKNEVEGLVARFPEVRAGREAAIPRTWNDLRIAALRHDFASELLHKYHAVVTSPDITNMIYLNTQGEIISPIVHTPETFEWNLDAVYHPIRRNAALRRHFTKFGFETRFHPGRQQAFVRYFYQAILTGAVGEEAVRGLLAEWDVHTEELPIDLFEIADLKIAGHPYFVDCKYYGESTLGKFSLAPDEYGYYHKFSSPYFLTRAVEKWNLIASLYGEWSRLIYINLASSQDRRASYLRIEDTIAHETTTFQDAHIIVIPAALDLSRDDHYQEPFEQFMYELTEDINAR